MAESEKPSVSWFNRLGMAILGISYIISLFHMYNVEIDEQTDNKDIIRIAHWQLESGIRDGMDVMAREFEAIYQKETGREVKVIQIPISEKAYRQYVSTQCMGGTAPDLIEMGSMDSSQVSKFFVPLTETIYQPNPYNRGTDLEHQPWKNTFFDGLSSSFDELALEYYSVGLSTFTVRLFYNKDLFMRALGHDRPPANLAELKENCEKLEAWAEAEGKVNFSAIAASGFQVNIFRKRLENSVGLEQGLRYDRDFDGMFSDMERMIAYCNGSYDFDNPVSRAGSELVRETTQYFSKGFMQAGRMESGFKFGQQDAAFITSGSFDAYSFIQQADFEIGICDFPIPARTDPKVGHLTKGGITESDNETGFSFGLTRFSKNPKAAIQFLQFLTSRKNNERFNKIIKWMPVINGAEVHKTVAAFKPASEGFWSYDSISLGPRSKMIEDQHRWEYLEHNTDFDTMIDSIEKNISAAIATDYERYQQLLQENISTQGARASGYLASIIFAPEGSEPSVIEKSEEKLGYLWESRMPRFHDASDLTIQWNQLLIDKKPRALNVNAKIFSK
jgi:raffinose/stachyose/melibiose transport system substrate-binding protein